jgi:hypothetical protein
MPSAFEIIELDWTYTEPLGFLLLRAALLDACIAHRFAHAPAVCGF